MYWVFASAACYIQGMLSLSHTHTHTHAEVLGIFASATIIFSLQASKLVSALTLQVFLHGLTTLLRKEKDAQRGLSPRPLIKTGLRTPSQVQTA